MFYVGHTDANGSTVYSRAPSQAVLWLVSDKEEVASTTKR